MLDKCERISDAKWLICDEEGTYTDEVVLMLLVPFPPAEAMIRERIRNGLCVQKATANGTVRVLRMKLSIC